MPQGLFAWRDRLVLPRSLPDGGTETWSFDGTQWRLHVEPNPLSTEPLLTWATRQGALLRLSATRAWEWDGAAWNPVRALTGAPPMAFLTRSVSRETLAPLCELYVPQATETVQTWSFDEAWARVDSATFPSASPVVFARGDTLYALGGCDGGVVCVLSDAGWTPLETRGVVPNGPGDPSWRAATCTFKARTRRRGACDFQKTRRQPRTTRPAGWRRCSRWRSCAGGAA